MKKKTGNQTFNPFLPGNEYIPDGEPRMFGDRVYLFGSHDAFGGSTFCVNDYVVWSAPAGELGNWRYEGVIYRRVQEPVFSDPEEDFLYAPDVQRGPDGRYYLYYSLRNSEIISVAVCDSPAGSYEFFGHVHYPDGTPIGRRPEDPAQFDPAIYVDGDQVFLYSGFCPANTEIWDNMGVTPPRIEGCMVFELEPDMVTVRRGPEIVAPCTKNSKGTGFEGHEFFEAPSLRKVGDAYYLIYSSINGHELCYALSRYPDRDFSYGGIIISNGDIGLNGRRSHEAVSYYGNNHGSILEICGQWYVFYHRHTNKNQFSRQACAEKISFDEQGHIPQAELTSCGLNDGPLTGTGPFEARIACNLYGRSGAVLYGLGDRTIDDSHPYFTQDGEDREEHSDQPSDQHIANITDGAVAGFKYFDLRNVGSITITARGRGDGKLVISNQPDGEVFGEITLETAKKWTEFHGILKVKNGITPLYFTFFGQGSFDILSFEFHLA